MTFQNQNAGVRASVHNIFFLHQTPTIPDFCKPSISELMQRCWEADPRVSDMLLSPERKLEYMYFTVLIAVVLNYRDAQTLKTFCVI